MPLPLPALPVSTRPMFGSASPRRDFIKRASAAIGSVSVAGLASRQFAFAADANPPFKWNYILGSCMYGYTDLDTVIGEAKKIGASTIDLWPKVHGDQREQAGELGLERFREMLAGHNVSVGCITQYKMGPFGLDTETEYAKSVGCPLMVTGGAGPKNLRGAELKAAVKTFANRLQPHLDVAAANGVTIAIENHGNNLIDSPDSLKWLIEFSTHRALGIALAPYHLPQDPELIAGLIRHLGDRMKMFYAWQHGMGCMKKLPKEQELLQMPGRGSLDFGPIVDALKQTNYSGFTEIFMHPVPRGIAILDSTDAVTDEINRSRAYLESLAPNERPSN